jgi:hypothetical protein
MNTSLANLTVQQLKRAAALKERIQKLEKELMNLLGAAAPSAAKAGPKKRHMSASAKARISAAAKARWAKIKAAMKK